MKIISPFILLCLFSAAAQAQKIKIKDNVIFSDDSAVYNLSVEKGGFLRSSYTIVSLAGRELIYVNNAPGEDYYEMIFLPTAEKRKIAVSKIGAVSKTKFIQLLIKEKVLNNGDLNESGRNIFLAKYEQDGGGSPSGGNYSPSVTDRNTSAEIFVMNKTFQQDFQTIGRYTSKSVIGENSVLITKYSIFSPDNSVVAELTAEEFDVSKNNMVMLKDNSTFRISGVKGDTVAGGDELLKRAVRYLIERRYL